MSLSAETYRYLGQPVPSECEGWRADRYLAERLPFLTRVGWQRRIRGGEVRINGESLQRPAARLRTGDQLSYFYPAGLEPEVERDILELWRDGPVMAVAKPAPLPMHSNGPYMRNTFANFLRESFGPEWTAVHRLDLETSGVVLCAATPAARARLHDDLVHKRMAKRYLAIVNRVPDHDAWEVDEPIGDLVESQIRIKKWVVPDGLPSRTLFSTVETGRRFALIEARPVTGRTNQIRIHAACRGHVLVGDKLYHPNEGVFLEYFEKGPTDWVTTQTGHRRLCLHAASLRFRHPVHGKEVEVEAPFPEELQALWNGIRESTGEEDF